jgi:hypothetical protein
MSAFPDHQAFVRMWAGRGLRFLLTTMLFCQAQGHAQSGLRPPCGMEPDPPYPELNSPPIVKFWNESDVSRDWRPPACTGWAGAGYSTLVTTNARFRYAAGAESLLRRIGAISELAGMRYWSTTRKQWRTLIVSAHALTDPQLGHRRQDFLPDELRDGRVLYFEQVDNLSGTAIYQMHIAVISADRLVLEVEIVSILSRFYVTLFRPSEVQSIYFLDRESNDVWRYYSLVRTGRNASWLAAGHPSSSINRAVAFYRSLAGIPTDQEPPAAR